MSKLDRKLLARAMTFVSLTASLTGCPKEFRTLAIGKVVSQETLDPVNKMVARLCYEARFEDGSQESTWPNCPIVKIRNGHFRQKIRSISNGSRLDGVPTFELMVVIDGIDNFVPATNVELIDVQSNCSDKERMDCVIESEVHMDFEVPPFILDNYREEDQF